MQFFESTNSNLLSKNAINKLYENIKLNSKLLFNSEVLFIHLWESCNLKVLREIRNFNITLDELINLIKLFN